jgi:hypothetical protein
MTIEVIIERRIDTATSVEDLAEILKHLLAEHSVSDNGKLVSIRALVEFIRGLRIEIFHTEHPPPHFHVKSADVDAIFSILDGKYIKGSIAGRERRIIEWWYFRSRSKLVQFWNETRPSNCPIGPIK